MSRRSEELYLLDMLIAARKALSYVEDVSRTEFDADEILQNAVVRHIPTIGEASRHIGEAMKSAHPEIPWSSIEGMRHRLVHEYFSINEDKVWEVLQNRLRPLIALIEPLVPPPEDVTKENEQEPKS